MKKIIVSGVLREDEQELTKKKGIRLGSAPLFISNPWKAGSTILTDNLKMIRNLKRCIHVMKRLECEYNKTGGQLDKRRKAFEEEYFHRQNRELLEKMQKKKDRRIEKTLKEEAENKKKQQTEK
ncbi:hypothetical protein HHI36_002539 [Cryptolaemus montrouzieri]|uniref:Uncharacterized protein n=1 Tax=Cryptolaemus montrouzieri TaxID=559131 RepID=A0ABD2PAY1_9CUCU